ncbi:hypothetical protein Ancab_019468 [Ancistrocladus abbreviatus]
MKFAILLLGLCTVVLIICIMKVAMAALDKALDENADIEDISGSSDTLKLPVVTDKSLDLQTLLGHKTDELKSLDDLSWSNSIANRKEKKMVEEMPATPPADDGEEQASKQVHAEGVHLSQIIYEGGRENSPSMMSSPRARQSGVHVSSREKVGANIWKLSPCSRRQKTDRKDGLGGSPLVFEIGCQKDGSKSIMPTKVAANNHSPTQVGPGHLGGRPSPHDRPIVSPAIATVELCSQYKASVGLASSASDISVAHKIRKSKSNSCKKGFFQKGSKGIYSHDLQSHLLLREILIN